MLVLGIETSCDETAAAVVTDSLEVLASVVASQDDLHRRFGGVVPEIASRAHLERVLPVIDETLRKANLSLAKKAICVARQIPLVAINHLQAHIYACRLAAERNVFPCVGLIVSGGHSSLYRCHGPLDFEMLGGTIDDAAGEAFDKVAAMLGLPYPGGPSIERAAAGGNPRAYAFPRALLRDPRLDFSFSGLKTAVRYAIAGPGRPDPAEKRLSLEQVADLAASFQEAAVDCLVGKAFAALKQTGMCTLCVGGGVAANSRLRKRLQEEADRQRIVLHIAPLRLCTDNAVMGAIAVERLKAGLVEGLDLDVLPGVIRKAV
jgi:N6-L-threonylcarbamoyladenine synthase